MAKHTALTGSPAQHRNDKSVTLPKEREDAAQANSLAEHYAPAIGAFQDDPLLDAMMANIRERRREMDADNNIH